MSQEEGSKYISTHRRSYVEEILIQLLIANLRGDRNEAEIWGLLRSELMELQLRHGNDVEHKFERYVENAFKIVMVDYKDVKIPLFNIWNVVDKLVEALKNSESFMSYVRKKHARIEEQNREILSYVYSVVIAAGKAVLKDYKVIWDESV